MNPNIEKIDGQLHLEFFGTAMIIDTKKKDDVILQLFTMIKVLELRVATLEGRGRRS